MEGSALTVVSWIPSVASSALTVVSSALVVVSSSRAAVPSGSDAAVALVGLLATGAVVGLVYRDAAQVGLDRPGLWAGIVGVTSAIGLATYLFVPTVPVPGLLVVVLAGPVIYLFERDDAKHGEAPADPHALADESEDESSTGSTEAVEE